MKTFLSVLLVVVGWLPVWGQLAQESDFMFRSSSGNVDMHGRLRLPAEAAKTRKLVIMLVSPDDSGLHRNGFYEQIADSLARLGIASYRFNSRLIEKKVRAYDGSMNFYDVANDGHDAFIALKKDRRFAGYSFGLLGQGEGGISAVVEASRNPEVKFVVTLGAMAVSGMDFAYQQHQEMLKGSGMSAETKKVWLEYMYKALQAANASDGQKDFKEQLQVLTKETYADAAKSKAMGMPAEVVLENTYRTRGSRHAYALCRFQPSAYYGKVKQPLYAVYPVFDSMLDAEVNAAALRQLFLASGKKNYVVQLAPNLDNSFCSAKEKVSMGQMLLMEKEKRAALLKSKRDRSGSGPLWIQLGQWIVNQN